MISSWTRRASTATPAGGCLAFLCSKRAGYDLLVEKRQPSPLHVIFSFDYFRKVGATYPSSTCGGPLHYRSPCPFTAKYTITDKLVRFAKRVAASVQPPFLRDTMHNSHHSVGPLAMDGYCSRRGFCVQISMRWVRQSCSSSSEPTSSKQSGQVLCGPPASKAGKRRRREDLQSERGLYRPILFVPIDTSELHV